jgi:hypothetical protein
MTHKKEGFSYNLGESFTEDREKTSSIQINKIRFFQLLHFFIVGHQIPKYLGPDPDSTNTDLKP